jgi:hypothetical protein
VEVRSQDQVSAGLVGLVAEVFAFVAVDGRIDIAVLRPHVAKALEYIGTVPQAVAVRPLCHMLPDPSPAQACGPVLSTALLQFGAVEVSVFLSCSQHDAHRH